MEIEKDGASKTESESDSARVKQHYLVQFFFQFESVNGDTRRFNFLLCSPIVTECTAYCQFLFAYCYKCGVFFRRKSMSVCIDFKSFSQLDICSKTFHFMDSFCWFVMRPSSLGGGRILRCTLSVSLSVCLSVRLSVRPVITSERHVAPPSELQ